ncbi:MAG TPA: hypothetical protein VI386_35610 [Candidatus Sulfotelmatobacter sp.]
MNSGYKEGVAVREEFERTMKALFRAPKTTERKQPKQKASQEKPKKSDKG